MPYAFRDFRRENCLKLLQDCFFLPFQKFHDTLVGGQGILLQLTDDTTCEDEMVLEAVHCLAAFCTIKSVHS